MALRFLVRAILSTAALASLNVNAKVASSDSDLRKVFNSTYKIPPKIPYRPENPYSKEKEALGKVLFFDQRVSLNRNQSCVSCHHPGLGWEMGVAKPVGVLEMPRKSPTLLNLAWSDNYFWDGRAANLVEQFHAALNSPKAMGMKSDEYVGRIKAIRGYEPLFKAAYPNDPTISEESVGKAIEIYERGLVSGPSPFDSWLSGNRNALSTKALAGARVFVGKGNCISCHSGWNFTDNGFHDTGLNDEDIGRGKVLKLEGMQHAFKTPTLRSVAQRPPYMHDGSLKSLAEVVDHYNKGGLVKRPSLAPEMKELGLNEEEKENLIEFLESLTGNDKPTYFPRIPM